MTAWVWFSWLAQKFLSKNNQLYCAIWFCPVLKAIKEKDPEYIMNEKFETIYFFFYVRSSQNQVVVLFFFSCGSFISVVGRHS